MGPGLGAQGVGAVTLGIVAFLFIMAAFMYVVRR
jgi:hypothetical protein